MTETFSEELSKRVALMVGVFLLVEGVWGFFSPVVFGLLTTNKLHATIHVVLGLAGLLMAWRGNARLWCTVVGAVLLVVGVLRFIPGPAELVIEWLAVNEPVAYVNIGIGALALLAAFIHIGSGNKRRGRDSRPSRLDR